MEKVTLEMWQNADDTEKLEFLAQRYLNARNEFFKSWNDFRLDDAEDHRRNAVSILQSYATLSKIAIDEARARIHEREKLKRTCFVYANM